MHSGDRANTKGHPTHGGSVFAALRTERVRPRQIRKAPYAWRLAVGTVCFGAFMGQLDASIVTLIFPALRREFHTSLASVQWVSLSYLLALVAFLIPVGRFSDAHGRKLMYLYGFWVFTIASAACGFAPNLLTLIGFRVVQGAGAAMLQANSVAIVTTSTPPHRLRMALGVQAAAQALGLAMGPTLGGLLVDGAGWRWVFWLNIPVGLLGLVAGRYLLPRTRHRTPLEGLDIVGLALLTAATSSTLLCLSAASGLPLAPATIAGLVVVAVGSGYLLFRRRGMTTGQLLDLTLLRRPAIRTGLGVALCGYLILFGPLVLVPIALIRAGNSATYAGLVLTPLPAGFALAAIGANKVLSAGWADHRRATTGLIITVTALAGMLAAPLAASFLVPLLALLGIGLGIFTPANNHIVMTAIPPDRTGVGGGLLNTTRGLGTALGVALTTLGLRVGVSNHSDIGPRLALGILLIVAVAASVMTWTPSPAHDGAKMQPATQPEHPSGRQCRGLKY